MFSKFFQKRKKEDSPKKIDFDLLKDIEPRGGITFRNEKCVSTGNAYIACIHIHTYPDELKRHWLSKITNIPNTIATVDVSTDDMKEVITNINRSIAEQSTRIYQAGRHTDRREADKRIAELNQLYREISNYGEIMKSVNIRIFVSNRNLFLLQEQVGKLIDKLDVDKYQASVFLNEGEQEFRSLLQSSKEQEKNMFVLPGQPLTASCVAAGNPFHFSSLEDKYGQFLGQTPCGGAVLFDLFHKSDTRLYYNALAIGVMRSGKSTLLKKEIKQRAITGDFIRTFDITGEFIPLTYGLGGKVIACDGTGGIQNPFEILKSAESDNGSFSRHISKLATWYKFLVPEAESNELVIFKNLLFELYESYKLLPDSNAKGSITELNADYYPIMEDFYKFVGKRIEILKKAKYVGIEKEAKVQELILYCKIENTFKDLLNNYGHIFNGHTTFDNLKDTQIVTYDMSKLKEMDSRVFDAQLFNILSTCWDNCVTNGTVMKQLYEEGKIKWEEIVHFLIVIDESHRWININKLYAVSLITMYMREAPKFFGGIILASQSIRDYVPEENSEGVDELKKLFELTQYKFIFHQESSALPLLDKIFSGVLTTTQRNRIPQLGMGETILCISGNSNIEFKIYLSKDEERLFKGGV